MTSISVPRRIALPFRRPTTARAALLMGFVAVVLVGVVALAVTAGIVGATSQGIVLPRVTVGGVAIGGLDRDAAERRLAEKLPSLSRGHAIVAVGGDTATVPYAEIGRGYEMEAMLDAAFGVGRDAGPIVDAIARVRSLLAPTDLPVMVHAYDQAAIDRTARLLAAELSYPAVNAAVEADGTEYTVSPASIGRRVDRAVIRSALATAVATAEPENMRLEIPSADVPPRITSAHARAAAAQARGVTAVDLGLRVPGAAEDEEPLTLAPATLAAWLSFGSVGAEPYALRIDETAVTAAVAGFAERVDREPEDASFAIAGGELGGVLPAAVGRELAIADSVKDLMAGLRERAAGRSVPSLALAVNVTEPAFTTAQAEAALANMQLVSSWTTYYVPGEGNGWGNNINIPAFDIDGWTLAPDEEFSFWGSVGPIVPERGFTYGGAIINGRSTQGVAIGGGICSTSTTIFNAALRYGLEMGERLNHYYYIDRYPDGLDATVSIMDGWAQDITFTNDTPNPIVIRGFGGSGWVRFDLWSVPTNRSVVLTAPFVTNRRSAIETTQVDPSMAPGSSKRVEFPHDGHDVSVTRYVYEADGSLLHEDYYFSSYATVNGITVVGPSAASSTEPSPTPAP